MNIDSLLQAHKDDQPCGENLQSNDDLTDIRGTILEKNDSSWKKVEKDMLSICGKSHDLEAAVYLTVALIHQQGFSGFAEGTAFIVGLLDQYWECLHPKLDEEDDNPVARINRFSCLFRFKMIQKVKKINLIENSKGFVSLANSNEIPPDIRKELFQATSKEDKQALVETLEECISNIERIVSLLTEKIKEGRSGFVDIPYFRGSASYKTDEGLLDILEQAKAFVDKSLQAEENIEDDSSSQKQEEQDNREGLVEVDSYDSLSPSSLDGINSRDDAINAITQIEEYFTKNEPTSPVPLLLRRAKKLIKMDFLELINDLAPDGVRQVENIVGSNKN